MTAGIQTFCLNLQSRLTAGKRKNYSSNEGVHKYQQEVQIIRKSQTFDYEVRGKWNHIHTVLSYVQNQKEADVLLKCCQGVA